VHATGLSLAGLGDIAQAVLAGIAFAALVGAIAQLRVSHNAARRTRVYDYADMLGRPEWEAETVRCQEELPKFTAGTFEALPLADQYAWLRLPNLIEEIAYLYNCGVLDRDVAAELVGVYVERLWAACSTLLRELRVVEGRPRVFIEWERMQGDTWRRRGVAGPLGIAPPAPPIDREFHRLRYVLSAEYRRYARRHGLKPQSRR
jgi:hypothetical protein